MIDEAMCVLNPAAGRGAAEGAWERAAPVLRDAGTEVEVARTAAPGHARELSAEAVRAGFPAVISVGGDGTVQEVASGILAADAELVDDEVPCPNLAIIPGGSGNDFVKALGLPQDPVTAAQALLESTPRAVDVGRVDDRWFMNGVGIGFDARVAVLARRPSPLRGAALYAWALLRTLRSHRPWPMQVEVDGDEIADRDISMVTVSNGPCHGGGFWLCPDAKVDDGFLDGLLVGDLGRVGLLRFLGRSTKRTHLERREDSEIVQAREVVVTSDRPFPVHADGEIISESRRRIELSLLPQRLPVLAPPLEP